MTRLIDADAFIEKLAHVPMIQEAIKKAMDTMPTIEAVPVVHGEWIYRNGSIVSPFWERYECSECGARSDNSKYCPNCGADMRG